ncbi:MAG: amidase [Oligoflexia bacterium]|nr:amidase [Oligoflexia bacterium]
MKAFSELDARCLASEFRRGTLLPTDCIEQQARLCAKHNPTIRALITHDYPRARQQLQKSNPQGRLYGLTFSAKDSVDVAGFPVGDGGQFERIPNATAHARLVNRLFEEGAICVGKGNMSEYGKSFVTDNKILGPTLNPFDIRFSAGGSSGGDAAAVAANMATFALVSDMGGSVRIPANFCGLFGLLPTRGVFPGLGLSHSPNGLVGLLRSHGVIARSLDDIELLHACLKEYVGEDPFSIPESLFANDSAATRIGVIDSIGGIGCSPEIQSSLANFTNRAIQRGCKVQRIEPSCFQQCLEPFITLGIQAILLQEDFTARDNGCARDSSKETSGLQKTRQRLSSELPQLSAERLLRLWRYVDGLRLEAGNIFLDLDLIVSPVCAVLPPELSNPSLSLNGSPLAPELATRFSFAANVLGLTALAFPTAIAPNGLPVGLQVMGPRFTERRLFNTLRRLGYAARIPSPIK